MPRVLLVGKLPLARRLDPAVLNRLIERDVLDGVRIAASEANHQHTLSVVRAGLVACTVNEVTVERLRSAEAKDCDLIVTVGGDGTVLSANALGVSAPLLTVNSDPGGSMGVFARTDVHGVAALIDAWLRGRATSEDIPRLAVNVDGAPGVCFLNDCLVASANPAAMSRYVLEVDGRREQQRSSGVWVATAAGSTAAIHSAGMTPIPYHRPALLFKVREPFQGHGMLALREGMQMPPSGLRLIPAMNDITLYVDGPHHRHVLPPGAVVEVLPHHEPLRLLRP